MEQLIQLGKDWFGDRGWKPFEFQKQAWQAYLAGKSGLVNAPTGSGKTYSLWMPILLEFINDHNSKRVKKPGLRAIWITPIRALAKEIASASQRVIDDWDVPFEVGIRTGDTPTAERTRQRKNPPQLLITTPESLHIMLAQKKYKEFFKDLKCIVADEWHELVGSKRGVQVELGLSRLKGFLPDLKIWGISATIGNMDEAVEILLGSNYSPSKATIIRADIPKKIEVISVLPDSVNELPWSGHLGIRMIDKIIPIIHRSKSTIIFTNTRMFAERWYQLLLERAPELAGIIAMHHGSISQELRSWVEDALYDGELKAVVSTSSLDLGVDFRPVETVIQVGSPKGVARFMQRAGRSGHQPGAVSRIYFVPTHSLELIEGAALRTAAEKNIIEDRIPFVRSFDVLLQYLMTLAVSDGFDPHEVYREVSSTFSYNSISPEEWQWLLGFMTTGGAALTAYDEYRKAIVEDGVVKVDDRRIALRHRLSIGTIVSDAMLNVRYVSGKNLGSIEEWFISRLSPGDAFWFAGKSLEVVRIKDMTVQVRKSNKKNGQIPSWQGGRMPLSSQMSEMIRRKIHEYNHNDHQDVEIDFLKPLLELQKERSVLPSLDEFLVEYMQTREGYHLMMFPFEGRLVHEGIAALIAYRISQIKPITFSIAMNDYGFELLSDQEIPVEEALETDILSTENLLDDIMASMNSTEMARRRFRDIASIAGLIFKGYPGKQQKERHIQSSSALFFDVFNQYDSGNLLLRQAYDEVIDFQLEEIRLRNALKRINNQKIILTQPENLTPLGFPIMVDRLSRERLSSERLEDRVKRMKLQFE